MLSVIFHVSADVYPVFGVTSGVSHTAAHIVAGYGITPATRHSPVANPCSPCSSQPCTELQTGEQDRTDGLQRRLASDSESVAAKTEPWVSGLSLVGFVKRDYSQSLRALCETRLFTKPTSDNPWEHGSVSALQPILDCSPKETWGKPAGAQRLLEGVAAPRFRQ